MPIDLQARIRSILDSPKPGILFNDITTLLLDAGALKETVEWIAAAARAHKPDLLAGIEARGFLFGAAAAYALGCGFVALRKKGKLPPDNVVARDYALEYGTATLEMRDDAVRAGQRVVLIDDLLATGGTLEASVQMLRQLGAVVPAAICVIELTFLAGRNKLDIPVEALLTYDS